MALAAIAMLMAVPVPWSNRAKVGYVLFVLILLGCAIYARRREERRRDWDEVERLAADRKNRNEAAVRQAELHREVIDGQQVISGQLEASTKVVCLLRDLMLAVRPEVAQTGPVGTPLLQKIDDEVGLLIHDWFQRQQHLATILAMQGHLGPQGALGPEDLTLPTGVAGPPGPFTPTGAVKGNLRGTSRSGTARSFGTLTVAQIDNATKFAQEIAQNPPTTPETVAAAAEQLGQYLMPAAAEVKVTAITPQWSLGPDSEAPPSKGGGA